jgi:hypothetical protein
MGGRSGQKVNEIERKWSGEKENGREMQWDEFNGKWAENGELA